MKAFLQLCSHAARTFISAIFSFALWLLWFGLVALLAVQLYIATANELAIPDFLLRQAEAKLAESGMRATFSRTSFDPTGSLWVEDVRVSLPAFAEPVLEMRSAFVRLNLWMLAVGRVEPSELRFTEATMAVPAMLSPSGRPEQLLRDLDVTIEPGSNAVTLHQLTARFGDLTISAHGRVLLARRAKKPRAEALAEFLTRQFPAICRQAIALHDELANFEEPALHLELSPSASGAITIDLTVLARAAKIDRPIAATMTNVRASTRLLLFGDAPPSHVEISADEIRLPNDLTLRGVEAQVAGRFRPGDREFDLREVALRADSVEAAGIGARAISARLFPRPLPRIDAAVVANLLDAPLAVSAEMDLEARSAALHFSGEVSPRILDVISRRLAVDVRKYYAFESLTAERGDVRLGPDWKFQKLTAHVRVPRMNSYGVIMEDGRAVVELEPHRFHSPDAFARVGENFARGTYEHNLKTHEYRFLLDGRLRPLEISRWFKEWWPNFFRQLEFPLAPPNASVDVRGVWRDGRRSTVFVFADVPKTILRDTEFDRLRTRLFIRPAFYDALEIFATRGDSAAKGRFTYIADPATHAWHTLDLALDSTLDLAAARQLLGERGARVLAPFQLAAPPDLKLHGTFTGPASPHGRHEKLRIEARTRGPFRFHNFPVQDVSFAATINDDEVLVENLEAKFGGGVASGRARVWSTGGQKRLGFDYALGDASLGQVAAGLAEFFAAQKGQPPAPPGKYVQEKANVRLDLAGAAEGRYDEPLSYRGAGNAVLRGAEIGEVPLLGQLSELIRFTTLRFTEARASFQIEGPKLVFPVVTLRGSNSAIDAHGEYRLDRRELDFSAKVFPFQESGNLIKSVVGAVLTPLSNALEVKLTGSIEKPEWAFVMGPTNILRSLAPPDAAAQSEAPAETPPPTAPNP